MNPSGFCSDDFALAMAIQAQEEAGLRNLDLKLADAVTDSLGFQGLLPTEEDQNKWGHADLEFFCHYFNNKNV